MTSINQVIEKLEDFAPPELQESYDNSGLITGDRSQEITGIMICLDCTEEVVDEAIEKNCNLIISHHPILFSGIKSLTGKNYVERTIIKAIKNDIAIYASHTNLDSVEGGVNSKIAEKLSLKNVKVLSPVKDSLRKLVTFCPVKHAEEVRKAIFNAGAGHIGNYDHCSFNVSGTGTFRGDENSDPFVGKKNEDHSEQEERIETIYPKHLEKNILKALLDAHPYEEVAYDLYPLQNQNTRIGIGMVGELEKETGLDNFLQNLKRTFNTGSIRHTRDLGNSVKKVALCGGSGSFLIPNAIASGADIFVTADLKYHQFFDADNKIILADIGHFESEQFTVEVIADILNENFNTFATYFSSVITNPINYF